MRLNKPDVSIIIPVYNEHPERMERAISSAISQQGCSVEVILVNDGSTEPATMEAIEKASRRKISVIHQRNEGLPGARNAGISSARADFILPLDSDDRFGPHVARLCLETLLKRPEAAVAVPTVTVLNEITGKEMFSAKSTPEFTLYDFCIANPIHACSMFRRSDWERFGGYDEKLAGIGFEDYEWWVRILASGRKAVAVAGADFFYHKRPNSMSAEMRKNHCAALFQTRVSMLRNSPGLGEAFALMLWDFISQEKNLAIGEQGSFSSKMESKRVTM